MKNDVANPNPSDTNPIKAGPIKNAHYPRTEARLIATVRSYLGTERPNIASASGPTTDMPKPPNAKPTYAI